ncbi:protein-glutamate O-methyltransferase [Aliiroseovarius sp.]|uniref:CheR family methyltransferase n=1 Tax=Aliiroseovarius sp. TaxID=1872442 RepID=UPI0026104FC8|nr:protein-glutamate O-methyltransferase [Aliiroseovarius sp.]
MPPPALSSPIAGPPLDRAAFDRLAGLAHSEAGLAIAPSKSAMVRTRLARRLRKLGIGSFEQYTELVESDAGRNERREMISALTTNVSNFFREGHHFTRLQEEVFPALRQRLATGGRVRIWSAGCSNGQEPYSLAIAFLEAGPLPERADFRVLASDIDPKVVAFGHVGRYHDSMMTGLSEAHRQAHFTPCPREANHQIVSSALRSMVVFRELNLQDRWPMRGRFDVIFCRNVVIYFDAATQNRLWHRFAEVLHPEGWMFLGHSERVSENCSKLFSNRGDTAYQRCPPPAPPPPRPALMKGE